MGELTIVLTAQDLALEEAKDTFNIKVISPLGVSDHTEHFKVYPNPADSELFLELPDNNELVHVDIFSSSGALFYSSEFTNSINIDVKQWPSGIYFIKSFNNKIRIVNKFVKN